MSLLFEHFGDFRTHVVFIVFGQHLVGEPPHAVEVRSQVGGLGGLVPLDRLGLAHQRQLEHVPHMGDRDDLQPLLHVVRDLGKILGDHDATLVGTARLLADDIDGAAEIFAQREDEPGRQYGNLLVRLARGEQGLDDEIAKFAELDSYLNPLAPAELYARAGNNDAAIDWLSRPAQTFARWELASKLRTPLLEPLHDDPRWLDLLEMAGIAPHQLTDVEFDPRITWADTAD